MHPILQIGNSSLAHLLLMGNARNAKRASLLRRKRERRALDFLCRLSSVVFVTREKVNISSSQNGKGQKQTL